MLAYKEGPPSEFRRAYRRLWKEHRRGFLTFAALDAHMDRITQGRFLVLQRRFRLTTLALLRRGEPVLLATLFVPEPGWPGLKRVTSIGSVCATTDLRAEEAELFWREVSRRHAELDPVGPMNGHYYLGLGLPPDDANAERVGFQTAAPHARQSLLYGPVRGGEPYRRQFTLETGITQALRDKLEADLSRPLEAGIGIRPFSHWHARRDFAQLNGLVNRAFVTHFDFMPLTEEESWDILRYTVPLLRSEHLLFVEHRGKPIGFCLGLRDYNRVLRNDGDLRNLGRLSWPRRWRRARIVHKGVVPEFGGRGLVNQARHRILLSFAREGVEAVENSYVDEGNLRSLKNVGATEGKPLHEYRLLRLSRPR